MWDVIDSGPQDAKVNMQKDAQLLENLDPAGKAILHFYDWKKPAATYGYFADPADLVDLVACQKYELDLARRPTGGGLLFHVADLAFSVLVPSEHEGFSENTLENYGYINRKVAEAVASFMKEHSMILLPEEPILTESKCRHFCMAKPTVFDVMMEGRKVAGAAQRRRKQGFLHQGSISIGLPPLSFLQEVLASHPEVVEAMQMYTHILLPPQGELRSVREKLKQYLMQALCNASIFELRKY